MLSPIVETCEERATPPASYLSKTVHPDIDQVFALPPYEYADAKKYADQRLVAEDVLYLPRTPKLLETVQ
jgi:hypothetical protein